MGIFGWKKSKKTPGLEKPRAESIPPQAPEPDPETDMIRVPEGFMVQTWPGEIPEPSFSRMDGGVLLASTGPGGDMNVEVLRAVFDGVERALERPHRPALLVPRPVHLAELFEEESPAVIPVEEVVVWTLQEAILDGWQDDPRRLQEMLRRFHGFASRKASGRILQIVCVKKPYLEEVSSILGLIQGLGIDVRELPPDGVALIEAHRPDGFILSGLPGKSLDPIGDSARLQPWRLNEERNAAASRGDEAELARLDEEEIRLLGSISRGSAEPRAVLHAPLLRSLLPHHRTLRSESARGRS